MNDPHESLLSLIRFVRERSPFYQHAYRDLPATVTSLEQVPVIAQDEFWEANTLDNNRLLTGPMEDGLILKSGGTTGKPKFSVFSRDEWSEFTQTFALKLAQCGLRKGDRVANLFYVGDLYGSFIFTHKVLEECPIRVLQLPISGITPISSVLKTIQEYGVTVIAGLPTTVMTLLDEIERIPGKSRTQVRSILFAGEPMQPDLRERVLRIFPGAEIRSIGYASNDAGLLGYADLSCGPNEFRCYDGEAIYEILDEATGNPIVQAGQEGRAVVTALKRSLMPVIRYPVGDRAKWLDPEGTADRKFLLLGRSEESARIASLTLPFDEVHSVLQAFSDRLGSFQFQLIVVHEDARDGLIIRIASRVTAADRAACERDLIAAFYAFRPIYRQFVDAGKVHPVRIDWSPPATLETNTRTGKLKRVIDLRLKPPAP